MAPNSGSKNGTRLLEPKLNPEIDVKTEPRFYKNLEPCFQSRNGLRKWFARTRRGGFRDTIIWDQNWTLNVMQANPLRRVLAFSFLRQLCLPLLSRGSARQGQRARSAERQCCSAVAQPPSVRPVACFNCPNASLRACVDAGQCEARLQRR